MKSSSTWTLLYTRFEPSKESLREALCTLGNGYFASRGAASESVSSNIHYPATYFAGVYNKLSTKIAGRVVVNEDLVNCPNWTFLTFRIGDGEWFVPSESEILSFRQELDMRSGILKRKMRLRDARGRVTLVESTRMVSMDNPHFGAIKYSITPQNYNEWITVRTMLDGAVQNNGVQRYRQLNSSHLKPGALGSFGGNGIYLSVITSQSKIVIAQASTVNLFSEGKNLKPEIQTITRRLMHGKARIGQEFRFFAYPQCTYHVEKIVSFYSSRDRNVKNPLRESISAVGSSPLFDPMLEGHKKVWLDLWEKYDIRIKGDRFSQWALRFHTFHLLQTVSIHNPCIDAGMPARGLHGEAYRGHIFWDEMFIMHFYDFHLPRVSEAVLRYRFRRLPKARERAAKEGYKGAMFPWQSGSSGGEETQILHLNPLSGRWSPDSSHLQRHVSFAIAYNVWNHFKRTRNMDFMIQWGGEILLSIARFGSSLSRYSKSDGRYHTERVMGPDEFHEKYYFLSKPGLKDNAYTNFMVVWTISRALEFLDILSDRVKNRLMDKLGLGSQDIKRWKDITARMFIPFNNKGVIEQFSGYFGLKELNWKDYIAEYGNIARLDRILKAEGKSPDAYKVAKQADVLMLFYLFTFHELKAVFSGLGYPFRRNSLKKNYEYYISRTSHGSTLSKVVHCYVATLLSKPYEAWWWFIDCLESDIYDTQRGTTPEGIHTGVMAGSLDIVIRAFAGITFEEKEIILSPFLPEKWQSVSFKLLYRGIWINFRVSHTHVSVLLDNGPVKEKICFRYGDKSCELKAGESKVITLNKRDTFR